MNDISSQVITSALLKKGPIKLFIKISHKIPYEIFNYILQFLPNKCVPFKKELIYFSYHWKSYKNLCNINMVIPTFHTQYYDWCNPSVYMSSEYLMKINIENYKKQIQRGDPNGTKIVFNKALALFAYKRHNKNLGIDDFYTWAYKKLARKTNMFNYLRICDRYEKKGLLCYE